jgi:hypothetical protein
MILLCSLSDFFCLFKKTSGANPIKKITPTPKFWSWRNYKKSLFQSYKTTLVLKITTKRCFFGVNYGVITTPKFVRRKLCQKMTLLRQN